MTEDITHKTFFKTKTKKKKSKGKTAKFSTEVKTQICTRDQVCIFCGNAGIDVHHVFYSQEANYGEDRNEVSQGILVCRAAHLEIHGCSMGEGKRQEAILYLKEYYEKS